jgi:cyanide dihydratase
MPTSQSETPSAPIFPKYKAAAVQAAPVFLDLKASLDKACSLIKEAGANGAKLIALPEAFIPGGPYWAWYMPVREGNRMSAELYRNSIEVPGPATEILGAAARQADAYVAIGVNERDGKTIYNSLLYFAPDGTLFGKHRKFRPTGPEKLVWGDGDGSTHKVYDTAIGRLGGLICGEHAMSLPGYTLAAMNEQVHVGAWLGFTLADSSFAEVCSRYHAMAYNAYVVCSQMIIGQDVFDRIGVDKGKHAPKAWSGIVEGNTGKILTDSLGGEEEGIVYAEIDLSSVIPRYFGREIVGHYWPKPFTVLFDDSERRPMVRVRGGTAERRADAYDPEVEDVRQLNGDKRY